jgi:SP family sugar:H+ symporter-like MFS transporter
MISFLFALFLVPETKGLTLEQVDRMMEETTPWTSAAWVPHDTFAHEMGLTEKGINLQGGEIGNVEHVQESTQEKAVV